MIALLCAHNSVNCHAVICLPIMYIFGERPLVNYGSQSYFPTLLTTVLISFHHHLIADHISLYSYFTLAHLILCVRQAGEIDNLFVLVGAKYLFVIVCRSALIYKHQSRLTPR